MRESASVTRSVIDVSTYLGRSATVEGATLGRSCDIRAHARVHEGAAIGDECTLGHGERRAPGRADLPVQGGRVRHDRRPKRRLGVARRRAQGGRAARCAGLVNVDLTPEVGAAARHGARHGAASAAIACVASTTPQPACRLIKRALIAGISSTGVHVDDLRVMPAAVNRHLLKTQGVRGRGPRPPERVGPGGRPDRRLRAARASRRRPALEKEIAKHCSRQEFRRASYADLGELCATRRAPPRATPTISLAHARRGAIQERVDSGSRSTTRYSSASIILPLVLGALEVEKIAGPRRTSPAGRPPLSSVERVARRRRSGSSRPSGADFGVVMDHAARADLPRRRARRRRYRSSRSCSSSCPSSPSNGADRNARGAGERDEPRRRASSREAGWRSAARRCRSRR